MVALAKMYFSLAPADNSCSAAQVIVEKAEKSDIPDIDKKKCVHVGYLGLVQV